MQGTVCAKLSGGMAASTPTASVADALGNAERTSTAASAVSCGTAESTPAASAMVSLSRRRDFANLRSPQLAPAYSRSP